jgi:hypothetical protein
MKRIVRDLGWLFRSPFILRRNNAFSEEVVVRVVRVAVLGFVEFVDRSTFVSANILQERSLRLQRTIKQY